MEAVVKVRLADLFDGPTDLVVLPCSTAGTVTGFVARALARHSIPRPAGMIELGDVEIMAFEGGDEIAQYVAFAGSVVSYSSTTNAIEQIAFRLGAFTREHPEVRRVSAPLLGAGAGGIQSEKVVAALKRGFCRSADPGASLIVHVLHRDVFDRLRINRLAIQVTPARRVRTFISHTSRSETAQRWVKDLALFLVNAGVEVRLDLLHLRHGMDLPQWMCNELRMADKVIVVCDELYKQRAEGRLGGVGWETMIIQGDIAYSPPNSTKYQIVVREEEFARGIPDYLRTKYAFHAPPSDPDQTFKGELLKEILDLPLDELIEEREFAL